MCVQQELDNLKGYAISIYKGLWEEALNKSLFHIIENFDDNRGVELSHYVSKVVGTILLGKYNHEIEQDTTLETTLNKRSVEEDSFNPANEILKKDEKEVSEDVKECVRYLLPMFIQDYKFFKSFKADERKMSYTGMFEMFSDETVMKSKDMLMDMYGSDMDYLYNLKKECHYRNFSEDRYKDSMDISIEYECYFRNVLIYKKLSSKINNYFYMINIEEIIDALIRTYYWGKCCRKIGSFMVYCTLSGNLVTGLEELRAVLEREFVGAFLSRFNYFRVVCYEKGKNIILSSTKELGYEFSLNIFEEEFPIPIKEVISRCSNA